MAGITYDMCNKLVAQQVKASADLVVFSHIAIRQEYFGFVGEMTQLKHFSGIHNIMVFSHIVLSQEHFGEKDMFKTVLWYSSLTGK